MPWKERMNWVYGSVVLLTYLGYLAVVGLRRGDGPITDVPYVVPLLASIGISIVATVAGTVVSAIVGAVRDPGGGVDRSDERDDHIEARGELVGYRVSSVLLLLPFGLAMSGAPHFWIANAIYFAFAFAALVSTAAKLLSYRRGF